MESLFTIGVYGFSRDEFFDALVKANIDFFCDIRRRRGMRGSRYSFANAKQLQSELNKLSIQYKHYIDLSPSDEIRLIQKKQDEKLNDSKRKRLVLSKMFCCAYEREVLSAFDLHAFCDEMSGINRPVLFCVETSPEACHRSILARKIECELSVPVVHLLPPTGGKNEPDCDYRQYKNERG